MVVISSNEMTRFAFTAY